MDFFAQTKAMKYLLKNILKLKNKFSEKLNRIFYVGEI